MIDRKHDLPINRQADVLRISRSIVCYLPRPVSATDLEVTRRLDRLHLEFPFAVETQMNANYAADVGGRRYVSTPIAVERRGYCLVWLPQFPVYKKGSSQTLLRTCQDIPHREWMPPPAPDGPHASLIESVRDRNHA